ncbi:MAG: ribosomal protein S18-alanine N-acetyltransferase [Oscillospiraceae bacterium]|nr:ribosomal protein S18-alanine N-acetyltransferase [Oscillospiraceae bacterium]
MMEYILMNESHITPIAQLEKQCFSDPWSEASIGSELRNPLSLWVVAMDEDRLAGYVGSQTVLGWADMMNLAVAPEYRRQGIGEALVDQLVFRLQKNDVSCLTLEVRQSNAPAISLYTKKGFVQVGRRPNYYHNPKEDALILRKELTV